MACLHKNSLACYKSNILRVQTKFVLLFLNENKKYAILLPVATINVVLIIAKFKKGLKTIWLSDKNCKVTLSYMI